MEVTVQFYGVRIPFKKSTRQMSTVLVAKRIKRGEDPPCHPTPRRVTLEISIKEMQEIVTIIQPEVKHAYCMSLDTLWSNAKYCTIT